MSGKTSVIELLRFGLGVGPQGKESLAHAASILENGKVYIEVEVNQQSYWITRTIRDENPISDIAISKPIVFSQREIESFAVTQLVALV